MFTKIPGSAQYVVIVQYPIEEEKGSVGSSPLHVIFYDTPAALNYALSRLVVLQIYPVYGRFEVSSD